MFSGLDLYITTETSLGHQNRFRNEGLSSSPDKKRLGKKGQTDRRTKCGQ